MLMTRANAKVDTVDRPFRNFSRIGVIAKSSRRPRPPCPPHLKPITPLSVIRHTPMASAIPRLRPNATLRCCGKRVKAEELDPNTDGPRVRSSADRPFKGDEETFDPARPDAALDFDGGDRFELPALSCMLVEHLLELVAGHLAADHALAELDHRVLVAGRHATTIVAASA
jgi:hypothetical protein